MTFQQMQAQKDKNSAAWHGADKATQDKLHQENLSLQAQMDKLSGSSTSFDKNSGTYKPSTQTSAVGGGSGTQQMFAGSGSTGGSYTPTSSAGGTSSYKAPGMDDFGNVDYSAMWDKAVGAGAGYDELAKIAQDRANKTYGNSAYGGYYQDAKQAEMNAYLNYMKKQQGPDYTDIGGKLDEFYSGISAAEQAALNAAIKSGIAGLESQKSGVTQSADEAARQAYIGYMQSQKAMPQALSAAGYSGGMADSQRLALDTTLQNNQKDIFLNRDNALNDIDTAIQKTRLEGSIQGAQSQAQLGRDAMSAYMSYISQKNAQASQDYWSKYGYDFQGGQAGLDRLHQMGMQQGSQNWQSGENQADRDFNATTNAQKIASDKAWNIILAGAVPDDDTLTAADISRAEAEAVAAQVRKKSAGSGKGGPYTNPTTPKKPDNSNPGVTQQQYNAAADRFIAGDYSQTVIETLLAAGADKPLDLARAAGFGSINDLEMGPIREDVLMQMLTSGEVETINIGGTLFYRKNSAGNSNMWLPRFGY